MDNLKNNTIDIDKSIDELRTSIKQETISKSEAKSRLLLLRQIITTYQLETEYLLHQIGVLDYE